MLKYGECRSNTDDQQPRIVPTSPVASEMWESNHANDTRIVPITVRMAKHRSVQLCCGIAIWVRLPSHEQCGVVNRSSVYMELRLLRASAYEADIMNYARCSTTWMLGVAHA